MSDILHANIFFFITSVAVVALAIMWVIILWYVIAILREVKVIVARVRKASEDIEHDFQALRASVKASGERVRSFGGIFTNFFLRMLERPARHAPRRPKREVENDDVL